MRDMEEPTITVAARVPYSLWKALMVRAKAEKTSASKLIAQAVASASKEWTK